jgi:hypothetical protein
VIAGRGGCLASTTLSSSALPCEGSAAGGTTCCVAEGHQRCDRHRAHRANSLYALRASRWHPHPKEVYAVSEINSFSFSFSFSFISCAVFGFRDLVGLVGLMPLGALYPSKSGLPVMNKHIVKHALFLGALCPSQSGLMNKHIVKHIVEQIVIREITYHEQTIS